MPMDDLTRAVMEGMAGVFPRVDTMTVADARALLEQLPIPPSPIHVARVDDRTIPGPAGDLPVRIYWPEGSGPHPIVVFFHGGGWAICNLDTHDGACRGLTNGAGCITISVDYRLAPENKFPAAAEDAYAAVRWASEHGAELGGDPARLAVAGDSAGGNLSAVAALMARDRGGPPIAFQVLVYPATDFAHDTPSHTENAEGYFLTSAQVRFYADQYLATEADRTNPYAAPMQAPDASGLPPALILTAEFDPLRDEGEAYGRKLEAAGVPVTIKRYDGLFHGFFNLDAFLPAAKQATEDVYAALREVFAR